MIDIKKYGKYISPEQGVDDKNTGKILFDAIYYDLYFGHDSIMDISHYINNRFDKIIDISSHEQRISYKNFLVEMINYKPFIPHIYIDRDVIYIEIFLQKYNDILTYIKILYNIFLDFDIEMYVQ